MEVSLKDIMEHPDYYKWCRACNTFNSVENESCHHCGSIDFEHDISKHIENEQNFQAWGLGQEPDEAFYTIK